MISTPEELDEKIEWLEEDLEEATMATSSAEAHLDDCYAEEAEIREELKKARALRTALND
jgi:chromosome segregation ATPase